MRQPGGRHRRQWGRLGNLLGVGNLGNGIAEERLERLGRIARVGLPQVAEQPCERGRVEFGVVG